MDNRRMHNRGSNAVHKRKLPLEKKFKFSLFNFKNFTGMNFFTNGRFPLMRLKQIVNMRGGGGGGGELLCTEQTH